MLRISRKLLHPVAQLRRMNAKVLCGLGLGHPTILDQLHRLKPELSLELPFLHDTPRVSENT
jgi:hypothetical protein